VEYKSECLEQRLPGLKRHKDDLLVQVKSFYERSNENRPTREQKDSLLEVYRTAMALFGEVENTITECGVLARQEEDALIRDLSGTSLNLLEKIPQLFGILRRHIQRLSLTADSFQPGSAAFQNMQSLVGRYHPNRVPDLKQKFEQAGLATFGFDAVSFKAPRVVFSLHGIRTRAQWQRTFADLAQQSGWECRLERWYFGRFSVFQFLSPFSREAKVKWFRKTYELEMNSKDLDLDRNQFPSVVAHSFGTYVLGYALLKYEYIRFNKVILCGSILPTDFPWGKLIERGQVQAVRNEYGVKDVWVRRVRQFVPNTGPSGGYGFGCNNPRLDQQEFHYDHSEYFEKGHMREYWIGFLDRNFPLITVNQAQVAYPNRSHPWLLYLIILAIVILGVLMARTLL
jgi:hypothetical protein